MRRVGCIIVALVLGQFALADTVLPLEVAEGEYGPRDSRVFSLPVVCNGFQARFVWGCSGWTLMSEQYAEKCGIAPKEDPDLAEYQAGGKPIFAGSADVTLRIDQHTHRENVKIMSRAFADAGMTGILGYNIASAYQWEINPHPKTPTLTLRPPGTKPTTQPLAVLPLKNEEENLWVSLNLRRQKCSLVLMPQSTDMQAGPELQRRWDIASGKAEDIKTYLGRVRSVMLTGKDAVELAPGLLESNILVILVGNAKDMQSSPSTRSGVGASLLNRFTYCVDPRDQRLLILSRHAPPQPATRASTQPAGPAPHGL